MTAQITYLLDEKDIPHTWYRLGADLPNLRPLMHPGTGNPIVMDDLPAIMPAEVAKQELSCEREIEIPLRDDTYDPGQLDAALAKLPGLVDA